MGKVFFPVLINFGCGHVTCLGQWKGHKGLQNHYMYLFISLKFLTPSSEIVFQLATAPLFCSQNKPHEADVNTTQSLKENNSQTHQ
jgi:hypothetical protein